MQYLWIHISNILDSYDGKLPLANWLKQYFKQNPKLGSRDRRAVADAVYAWYRCGKALPEGLGDEQKIYTALFLSGLSPKGLQKGAPDYYYQANLSVDERIAVLSGNGITTEFSKVFPYPIPFSYGITKDEWTLSLLMQPKLFLRTRKPKAQIETILRRAEAAHEWIGESCVSLPNGTNVETILPPETYWIMDASSQRTGEYFSAKSNEVWWDCCSGAGGKSLLLKQQKSNVRLTVSDVRESILQNLGHRFKQYNVEQPEKIVLDVADNEALSNRLGNRQFDAILCDAPCTGSGTWARTPEGAYFFEEAQLAHYTSRQEAILTNASGYLKPGGRIVYITCSVFSAENEDVLQAVASKKGLAIEDSKLINGIPIAADCLFVGIMRKGR